MRIFAGVAAWCLLAFHAAADTSVQALLKHVPAKSQVVVVIPSIEKFVKGAQAFGKAAAVEDMEKVTAEELFQMQLGAAFEHMNTSAPVVFAGRFDDDQPIFICVMKEGGAIEKLEGSKKDENGIISFDGGMGTSYAGIDGEIAMIGVSAEQVSGAVKADGKHGEAIGKSFGKLLEKNQVLVYLDPVESKSQIDQGLTELESSAEGMAAGGPQAAGGAAMIKWMTDSVRYMVGESQAWVIAARLGESGASVDASLQAKSEGKLATYLKGMKKSEVDLLATMPDEKTGMVFGYDWTPPSGSESITEQFMRALLKGMPEGDAAKKEELEKMMKQATEFAKLTTGSTFSLAFSPDKKLLCSGAYIGRDAKALSAAHEKLAAAQQAMTQAMAQGVDVKVDSSKEKIGSVEASVLKMSFNAEDPVMKEMFDAMYGAGMTFIAGPSPVGLTFAFGPDTPARELFGKLGDGKGPGLGGNAEVKKAMSTISARPAGFALIDLLLLFDFGMTALRAAGMPVPEMKLPQGAPNFVACGLFFDPETVRIEMNVPAAAVKSVVEAFNAMSEDGAH